MGISYREYLPKNIRYALVDEWGSFVDEKIEKGWKAYLVTFTFNRLPGREDAIIRQMSNEIERFYASLVKRVVRKPRSINWQHLLPILIAQPDFAGSRHGISGSQDLIVNDGLHFHAIVLIAQRSRLREGLTRHIRSNYPAYLGEKNHISAIDVQRIMDAPGAVVGYSQKAFKHGRFSYDYLLVLPKALSELPPKSGLGAQRE
jgi:hypothetical protein